jgi:hypothetical protein
MNPLSSLILPRKARLLYQLHREARSHRKITSLVLPLAIGALLAIGVLSSSVAWFPIALSKTTASHRLHASILDYYVRSSTSTLRSFVL